MIVNVPTAGELREVSVRLYFKAWDEVVGILNEFATIMGENAPEWSDDKQEYLDPGGQLQFAEEWVEYIDKAQQDLQGVYALIQQSQEIGLKALICDVSPYLLLRRSDARPDKEVAAGTWDFTDFATIDAQNLVKIHDTFCARSLSPDFAKLYDEIRKGRNKISHLGVFNRRIAPHKLISDLQKQYGELYPHRRWMTDRQHMVSYNRWSEQFEDTALAIVMGELRDTLPQLSDGQFRWLMGHTRSTPRYVCHPCSEAGKLSRSDISPGEIPTAYLSDDGAAATCAVCAGVTRVFDSKCWDPDCTGHLRSEPIGDIPSRCMTCGIDERDWAEQLEFRTRRQSLGAPWDNQV